MGRRVPKTRLTSHKARGNDRRVQASVLNSDHSGRKTQGNRGHKATQVLLRAAASHGRKATQVLLRAAASHGHKVVALVVVVRKGRATAMVVLAARKAVPLANVQAVAMVADHRVAVAADVVLSRAASATATRGVDVVPSRAASATVIKAADVVPSRVAAALLALWRPRHVYQSVPAVRSSSRRR